MQYNPPSYVGLLTNRGNYTIDSLVSFGKKWLHSVNPSIAPLESYRCPYNLPAIGTADTVLIVAGWLCEHIRTGDAHQLIHSLRQNFRRVVAIDAADPFQLELSERSPIHFNLHESAVASLAYDHVISMR